MDENDERSVFLLGLFSYIRKMVEQIKMSKNIEL